MFGSITNINGINCFCKLSVINSQQKFVFGLTRSNHLKKSKIFVKYRVLLTWSKKSTFVLQSWSSNLIQDLIKISFLRYLSNKNYIYVINLTYV